MKINYKSDFKLREISEVQDGQTPFVFEYKSSGAAKYTASYDGSNYVNCRPLDDGSLLVIFDNHKLGLGRLQVRREYMLFDEDCHDGIYNQVTVDQLDVVLTTGQSDDYSTSVDVYPAYQKGEKGDPLLYEDLTEDQKTELKGEKGESGTTELMSFEIVGDDLYVTAPDSANVEFSINTQGELIVQW